MRTRRLAIGGTLLLVIVAVTAIGIGAVALTPGEVIAAIAQQFGISVGSPVSASTSSIVIELRAPRILAAIVVGAALAVAGGAFQSLLRNPLADPYVLGTSSGAALGAALAFLVPISGAAWELGGVQLAAFVGALLSVALVWRIAGIGSGEERIASVLLVGYAVASLLAAALSLVMLTSGANLRAIFGFLLGGLDGASWPRLAAAAIPAVAASLALALRGRPLAAFLLGDEAATHLGVNVQRERKITIALASLATGAAVALAGLVGFVGLVVPHLVRLMVGPDPRAVLPLSAIGGALLLLIADTLARTIGVPVGVITALIGAPFLLWLLQRARAGYAL
ncbi:MAG: iron ABC transporter permease [Chloroflexi bacterium]|jgi:iron complex transport system permease protein|nr:MAG: iron ABC transporter permease [Chloroflexota bacterium]